MLFYGCWKPVSFDKGSGSHVHYCPRPCSSTHRVGQALHPPTQRTRTLRILCSDTPFAMQQPHVCRHQETGQSSKARTCSWSWSASTTRRSVVPLKILKFARNWPQRWLSLVRHNASQTPRRAPVFGTGGRFKSRQHLAFRHCWPSFLLQRVFNAPTGVWCWNTSTTPIKLIFIVHEHSSIVPHGKPPNQKGKGRPSNSQGRGPPLPSSSSSSSPPDQQGRGDRATEKGKGGPPNQKGEGRPPTKKETGRPPDQQGRGPPRRG